MTTLMMWRMLRMDTPRPLASLRTAAAKSATAITWTSRAQGEAMGDGKVNR